MLEGLARHYVQEHERGAFSVHLFGSNKPVQPAIAQTIVSGPLWRIPGT